MKRNHKQSFTLRVKNTVLLSLFFGAAGFVATSANAQQATWSGEAVASSDKVNVVTSQTELNIAPDVDYKLANETRDANGVITGVDATSVDLNLKATSTAPTGSATAFSAQKIQLVENTVYGQGDQKFAENVNVASGNFKLNAEATAPNGLATAVQFDTIEGGTSSILVYEKNPDGSLSNKEVSRYEASEGTSVDIKALASGNIATAVNSFSTSTNPNKPANINADSVKIDATATSKALETLDGQGRVIARLPGGATGINFTNQAVAINATNNIELKASAEAEGSPANGIFSVGDFNAKDVSIEASATTKAIDTAIAYDAAGNATVTARQGENATAINLPRINATDKVTIKALAEAEGGAATAFQGNIGKNIFGPNPEGPMEVLVDASAKSTIVDTVDAAGNVTGHQAGNATGIRGNILANVNWVDQANDGEAMPTDSIVKASIKAIAETEGGTAVVANATAMLGSLKVNYDETKTIAFRELPQQLTRDVSFDVNLKANAGSLGDGAAVNTGNATALNGTLGAGTNLTVDNFYVAEDAANPAKTPAELYVARSKIEPLQMKDVLAKHSFGKVAVNGSFEANAIGGNATGINAVGTSISICNTLTGDGVDYQTTQAYVDENGLVQNVAGASVSAFDPNGNIYQAAELKDGVWGPKVDENKNPVYVELSKDANGDYVLAKTGTGDAQRVSSNQFVSLGDLNADVKATSIGGNATAINATNIEANLNGEIFAESKSRVFEYHQEGGVDTTHVKTIVAGSATGIEADDINVPNPGLRQVYVEEGAINGNITAISEGGVATGIKANNRGVGKINGNINGNITAISNATEYTETQTPNLDGTFSYTPNARVTGSAVGIDVLDSREMTVNSIVSAKAQIQRDAAGNAVNDPTKAVAIKTGNGIVNLGNGAILNAKVEIENAEGTAFNHVEKTWNAADKKYISTAFNGYAIDAGAAGVAGAVVNVEGRADANGSINSANLNVNGGTLAVAGDITAANVNIAEGAKLARTADAAGNFGTINANVTYQGITKYDVNPDYATMTAAQKAQARNEYAAEARAGKVAGNATMLVNDKKHFGSVGAAGTLSKDQAFKKWDANDAESVLTADEINALPSQNGDSVNFSYIVDAENNVSVKVNGLSYFQNKATDANSARLGSALDAITTIDPLQQEQYETDADFQVRQEKRENDIQSRRDFKSNVEAHGFAKAGYNGLINLSEFMPVANSYISQVNSDMLMNMNTVQMFRLSAIADAKRAGKKVTVDGKPNDQASNVAEFQSINMLGSQDGGTTAAGFDFWSAGGVAAIERDFSDSVFAGLSLGGVYNKVDADDGSNASSTNFIVNVYGEYSMTDIPLDFFLNVGYSHGWNDVSRPTSLGMASADFDSNSFYSLGGVAYTFSDVFTKGLSIKPMLMYNLAYSSNEGATENGAGFYNAQTADYDHVNIKSLLGFEIRYDIDESFAVVGRAFWSHEFGDNTYDVDYRIAAANFMPTAQYRGEEISRDAAVMGIGVQYKFSDSFSGFLDYSATLRDDYLSNGLNLGAQFKF